MSSSIKRLSTQSLIYGLGSLASKLLGLILLPVYTRYLTPADYGVWSLLSITGSVAAVVAQMGMGSALFMEISYRGTDRRVAEGTALLTILLTAGAILGGAAALAPLLSEAIYATREYTSLLRLVLVSSLLGTVDAVIMARMRIQGDAAVFSTVAVSRFLMAAGLNIYFIVVLRRGVEGLAIASLITAGVFATLFVTVLVATNGFAFAPAVLRRMLRFGLPLVPANLASMVLVMADRYVIGHYASVAEVGLYTIGYNIGLLVNLAVQALQLAWPAHMFAVAKQPDARDVFARTFTYYVAGFGFLCLAISTLAREALVVFATPQFYDAARVVPAITVSYLFYGAVFMTNVGVAIRDRMRVVPFITIGAAIVNVVLNLILVPRYGMMGAAWATVASYIFLLAVQLRINLTLWHIPYEYFRILKIGVAALGIYTISRLVPAEHVALAVLLKMGLLAAFPLALFTVRFYEQREHARIRAFWSRIKFVGTAR